MGHMVTLVFNTLRNCQAGFLFQRTCTTGVLISLHPLCIPGDATLRDVNKYLFVVLVCIPLMVNDVGPYFSASLLALIYNLKIFSSSLSAVEHFIMLVCISVSSGFEYLHKSLALGISYSMEFCSYLFKLSVGFPVF